MAKQKEIVLLTNNKISSQARELIFDNSINNRHKTLEHYLKDLKIPYNKNELKKLIKLVNDSVYDQLSYFAHLMYHMMELSGNWGDAGEQQIKISFCRVILDIPSDQNLSSVDAFNFMTKVEENLQAMGIKALSVEAVRDKIRNFSFNIADLIFTPNRLLEFNRIRHFIGSTHYLQGIMKGEQHKYILGTGSMKHIGGYDVYTLDKELMRTPNVIVPAVAIIGDRSISLRKEAFTTIFYQKWLHLFQYDEAEKTAIKNQVERNLSEGIKQRTLKAFKATSEESLANIKDDFIKDMMETVMYHEIGHGLIQNDVLELEEDAIIKSTQRISENIFTAITEFLADFIPKFATNKGPIQNIIDVAKKDVNRATRMYYMYFSDTWFFDTDDTYMYTYSDLMSLILLKYIDAKGNIDFVKLEEDIQYNKKRVDKTKLTMFERVVELTKWGAQEIKQTVMNSTFSVAGKAYPYPMIRKLTLENFEKEGTRYEPDTFKFQSTYWAALITYTIKFSDGLEKIKNYLKDQEKKTLMKVFILAAGRKKAETYNYNHRKYVQDRMQELGIVAFKSEKPNA